MELQLAPKYLTAFRDHLRSEEKSDATVEKYLRDAGRFLDFAGDTPVTKELAVAYKKHLEEEGFALRSVNSMLTSLNRFLAFLGAVHCRVRTLKTQRRIYASEERTLTKAEYLRLLDAARGKKQLFLVLQTICATGIRVSELRYFTREALTHGEITVTCKGKTRTILIPGDLRKKLVGYAAERRITRGPVFVTRSGNPLDRSNLWHQMKKLCAAARVNPKKVFPHNLRKLFARTFYQMERDIAKLADILGHGSIETTRIYIMSTGVEHRRRMERLGLLC